MFCHETATPPYRIFALSCEIPHIEHGKDDGKGIFGKLLRRLPNVCTFAGCVVPASDRRQEHPAYRQANTQNRHTQWKRQKTDMQRKRK